MIRTAEIRDAKGEVVFKQEGVEFPESWSQNAVNIVASKYFRGHGEEREHSLNQLVDRVVDTITEWGFQGGYFEDSDGFETKTGDSEAFAQRLKGLILEQKAAFNSPVWFNVGVHEKPQCSACFINTVEDDMESIMKLATTEAFIFKNGSGSGVNLSELRGSMEKISVGGYASGPVSFMQGYDSFAGVIKSGGATRRAAKMVILDADHPDIREFIWCKAREEQKAHALVNAGFDDGIDGDAYATIQYQNANNSVRVSNQFMERVRDGGGKWALTTRREPFEVVDSVDPQDLLLEISQAAWECGDPGLQFKDTINKWHTCKETDEIRGCNPCSEFVFLDNSACNLASLNLLKFIGDNGEFQVEEFRAAVRTMILAQEILVSNSSYPTPEIEQVSHDYRPLGLGYANLGAALMVMGLPYDSAKARVFAASVTSLMTAEAYTTSANIASRLGRFVGFHANEKSMLDVIRMHRDATVNILDYGVVGEDKCPIAEDALEIWNHALELGEEYGYRNAQVTLIAPTGTIAFMMDCDTTGIEPDFALVKCKQLVGGGEMTYVNDSVGRALAAIHYNEGEIEDILATLHDTGELMVREDDKPIFATANEISWKAHIDMCAAVQPYLSGAISKTINMPNKATVEDVKKAYEYGWAAGMKSISIYRDGCKKVQPLSTARVKITTPVGSMTTTPQSVSDLVEITPQQRNMPKDHPALQHEFKIKGFKGFLTTGLYDDGTPGEIFLNFAKQGSTLQGMAMALAIAISVGLQWGVPLKEFVKKFAHMSFEPAGLTDNKDIKFASSIPDYVARYLARKFITEPKKEERKVSVDVAACLNCGNMAQRNGNCYVCSTCGSTTGCG